MTRMGAWMLLLAAALATTTEAIGIVGGYKEIDVDDATAKDDLYSSLNVATHYSRANDPFLCVKKITHIERQVVSGYNYKYTVEGCQVDSAKDADENCKCHGRAEAKFDVEVYVQSWTGTKIIKSIERTA
ncbi:hypothetical protein LEN26_011024 [Aphanomyces euteiches]|nr:hypothetical protein AeMF1_021023 [Aphanomyces euteiches]KAH9120652.1 hypothetical protein LEN26_011024 [Aphanomyces euteiches]KAH9192904.1 hypothetical protein AeNC1_005114 [Aphanomyces euteiches]